MPSYLVYKTLNIIISVLGLGMLVVNSTLLPHMPAGFQTLTSILNNALKIACDVTGSLQKTEHLKHQFLVLQRMREISRGLGAGTQSLDEQEHGPWAVTLLILCRPRSPLSSGTRLTLLGLLMNSYVLIAHANSM